MLLHEISIGGLLFSPLIMFILISMLLTLATRYLIHSLSLTGWIWRGAWFDVSLFFCFLALSIAILGR